MEFHMSFKPKSTAGSAVKDAQKILIYGHAGFGKTTQASHMKRAFGPGFIISGEAGLSSVSDQDIDYLPFSSFDGEHDPVADVYSFVGIVKMMKTPDFAAMGYRWIMLDSLTELSDRLMEKLEDDHRGSKNGFALWGDYSRYMLGAVKWIRDRDVHVIVTALAKEETDDNGEANYWPNIKGSGVQKQIPGIFDTVLGAIRHTDGDRTDPTVRRFFVTDEVRGWHGKVRDPYRRLKPVIECADVTEVIGAITRGPDEQRKYEEAMKMANETIAAVQAAAKS
jgi:energy-coupling factor transporter ATP-binding protein EcfA2